ncbi:MAG: cell division protein ZapA [Endomicrobium sp.]|jgi:cell division protein ZapA|nr:cell division protein ZapA [Endomicrobium sp.]
MATARTRIMGRDIDINVDEMDELSFSSVVNYVNDQWQEVQRDNSNVPDTQKIAAMTAIKIAAELLKTKGLQESISDNYERKIKELIKLLEEVEYSN